MGAFAGALPGAGRLLLGVGGGEGGPGGVAVGGSGLQPAGLYGFLGLLLDLGEALAQVAGLAAGALGLGGGGGGVAVGGLAFVLEVGGALLQFGGDPFAVPGGGVQGADQGGGGLRAGGEGGGGVAFGLADGVGDAGGAVGGGAVAQDGLGGLPGGVQGAGVGEFAALGGGGLLGDGEGERGVPVGEFGGDQGGPGAGVLGPGDAVGGGGDLLGEVAGAGAFVAGAQGEAAGEGAGAAFGGGVDVAAAVAFGGGLDDAAEQVDGAGGEVAFGDEFGAAAEFVAEAVDEVGEAVGVAGVGDGAQQQVGEVGVLLDREEAGGLALVGVHLPLVAEEFGVEAEFAEVLGPAFVGLLPVHVEVEVELPGVGEGVAEPLHGAAPAARPGGALDGGGDGGGLGDGQRVEAEPWTGAEGVPGFGELPRVVGDLAAAPLADLADDDGLAGEGVLPLQGDMAAVVGEEELAEHAGAGAAERVAVAGEHHREDQLEQDGLAAAVLQEEDAGGGGPARWADRLLLEELRLGGGRSGHGLADPAQVQDGVGVPGACGSDGVEADPGQLVHGGGLSLRSVRSGGGRRAGLAVGRRAAGQEKGSPASATRSRSSPSSGGSRVAVPSLTGTMPRPRSSLMAAPPARSRTWSW